MKNIILLLSTFVLFTCKQVALDAVPEQISHYNHEIFEDNKLAPRASFFAFENDTIPANRSYKYSFTIQPN